MRSPVPFRRVYRRGFVVLSTLFAALVVGAPARAGAAETKLRALIVPPEVSGGAEAWSDAIVSAMSDRLKAQKMDVTVGKDLTADERACRDTPCFTQMTEKRNVDLVVALKAAGDGQKAPTVFLTVFLFDRAKPFGVERADNVCQACTRDLGGKAAGDVVSKALGSQPPSLPPGIGGGGGTEPGGGTAGASGKKKLYMGLGVGAVVLAAGSAAAMVLSILAHGQPDCDPPNDNETACGTRRNAIIPIILGGAGTAIFAAASAGFFVLAKRADSPTAATSTEKPTSLWFAPVFDGRQVGLGIGGQF